MGLHRAFDGYVSNCSRCKKLVLLKELEAIISQNTGVLLYFWADNCAVCSDLRPKVKKLFDDKFPAITQIYLEANQHKEVSLHFSVFTVPTLIVFLDGKETIRETRAMSLVRLSDELLRPYGMMVE